MKNLDKVKEMRAGRGKEGRGGGGEEKGKGCQRDLTR